MLLPCELAIICTKRVRGESRRSMEFISLRMIRKSADRKRYLRKGPFILDLQEQQVQLHRSEILIPPGTFHYLTTLLLHAPNPVTYRTLVMESSGIKLPALEAQDMARLQIWLLRRTIEKDPNHPLWLQTVAGVGYRLAV